MRINHAALRNGALWLRGEYGPDGSGMNALMTAAREIAVYGSPLYSSNAHVAVSAIIGASVLPEDFQAGAKELLTNLGG